MKLMLKNIGYNFTGPSLGCFKHDILLMENFHPIFFKLSYNSENAVDTGADSTWDQDVWFSTGYRFDVISVQKKYKNKTGGFTMSWFLNESYVCTFRYNQYLFNGEKHTQKLLIFELEDNIKDIDLDTEDYDPINNNDVVRLVHSEELTFDKDTLHDCPDNMQKYAISILLSNVFIENHKATIAEYV
jgi:hypothetical protein